MQVEIPAGSAVQIPWGVWTDDTMRLDVPAGWTSVVLAMADAPALTADEIERSLAAPIEAAPLEMLAGGKRSAAIAVDDITRPTPAAQVLPGVVRRLTAAGIPERDITIVVASGAHRVATARDIERKIGAPLAARLRVVGHDCEHDLVDTGVELAGVPVRINRAFASADLRIGVSAVMPHPFAAFSGGGKILVPGVADLDVLARTHKFALMGLHGGDALEKNRFRTAMEAAVRRIGLHWTVNVVVNSHREIAAIRVGDFVTAHRAAAADAVRIGRTLMADGPLDALVLNAYPKDGELLQAEAAFVALRGGVLRRLRPGAPVVLIAACREGLGTHRLLGPGGRLFRPPAARHVLDGHELIVFASGIREEEARSAFCGRYPVTGGWAQTVDLLRQRLDSHATIGVIPCGPLQVFQEPADA